MSDEPPPPHYRAADVRGAEVVLRKRWQRLVFFGALAAAVVLAVALQLA